MLSDYDYQTSYADNSRIVYDDEIYHSHNNARHLHITSAPVKRSHTLDPTSAQNKRPFTPYASRTTDGYYKGGAFVPSRTSGIPSYNPFDDPFMADYYQRRFEVRPRPRSAHAPEYSALLPADKAAMRKRHPVLLAPRHGHEMAYKVAVTTADEKGAGTTAPAYITIRGVWGQLLRQRLSKRSVKSHKKVSFKFAPGSTHTFQLHSQDLGEIQSIVIEHSGIEEKDSWLVQSVEVMNVLTRKSWLFVCNHWLSLHKEDGKTARELFGVKSSKTDYEIVVVTGDIDGAATTARVFATLFGRTGISPRIELKHTDEDEDTDGEEVGEKGTSGKHHQSQSSSFQRGKSARFVVRAPCVGPLTKVRLQHDNSGADPSWFVERMVVTDMKHSKWKFYFNIGQWFSRTHGDGLIARDLEGARDAMGIPKHTQYKLTIFTGKVDDSGTTSNVHIQLFGESGSSSEMPLHGTFGKSSVDETRICCRQLGPLTKLRIGHDNTGVSPGWFLDKVIVDDEALQKVYRFECGKWFDEKRDDGRIERTLLCGSRRRSSVDGKKRDGGILSDPPTCVSPSIALISTQEEIADDAHFMDSIQMWTATLSIATIDIEVNHTPRILHRTYSYSNIPKILHRADSYSNIPKIFNRANSYSNTPKICHRADSDTNTRCVDYQLYVGSDEEVGHCSCGVGVNLLEDTSFYTSSGHTYEISVTTGNKTNAGTSAKVYIVLYGPEKERPSSSSDERKKDRQRTPSPSHSRSRERQSRKERNSTEMSSGRIWLKKGLFQRGRMDIFKINVPENLSPLTKIDIGHDNSGTGPGWYLDKVAVNSFTTGIEQTFPCGKWLAKDEDDEKIERTLKEDISQRKTRKTKSAYVVTVHTSNIRNAGTDGQVTMTVYGNKGKTEDMQLVGKSSQFEKGSVDTFRLDMEDVGVPYKMRIGHDNSGVNPGWHLDKVTLKKVDSRDEYTFRCGKWLAVDEDDHAICRELPATGPGIKRPARVCHYKVKVHTGNRKFAGTDANVFINIFGEQGDTGDRPLTHSATYQNKFEKGHVDEFTIEAVDLEKIQKVRIGHDGKNPGAGWFLDKVEITEEEKPKNTVTFECHRWFDTQEDDGQIVRELKGTSMLDRVTYEVHTKTGDKSNAGTDANVFIQLFGSHAESDKIELKSSETAINKFERGRTDTFRIESEDLGRLKRVRIGHDGTGPGSGWFLDDVKINVPHQGRRYVFAANRWLDTKEADGKLEVDLDVTEVQDVESTIPYELTVYTGDLRNAGTDANVFIQIYGEDGQKTETTYLRSNSDNFQRGYTDKFKINALDVGPIQKIRIGHDGKGMGDGWYLEKLQIKRFVTKASKRRRQASRRKSRRGDHSPDSHRSRSRSRSPSGTHKKSRDEESDSDDRKRRGRSESKYGRDYETDTRRRSKYDKDDRSPDRRRGRSDSKGRDRYEDDFEEEDRRRKGRHDYDDRDYSKRRSTLYEDRDQRKEHDRDGRRSGSLRYGYDDERSNKHRSSSPGKHSSFSKRLSSSNSSISSSSSEFSDLSTHKRDNRHSSTQSKTKRDTSKRAHSSTTSLSKRPSSGKVRYSDDSDQSDRERSRSRHSKVTDSKSKENRHNRDKSPSSRQKGRHSRDSDQDSSGSSDVPVITGSEEVEEYWFMCKRWFAVDEDDGLIVRELLPENSDMQEVEYLVTVKTGDKFGSGTDANVFLTIYGQTGDSGERELKESLTNRNKFEAKSEDKFKIKAIDLGRLKKVKIRHDNAGGGAAWFLEHIVVKDPRKEGREFFFPCRKWLATDKEDGLISRDLPAIDRSLMSSDKMKGDGFRLEESELNTTYNITVTTGDKSGAGTDAEVHIILFGEKDDTGVIPLTTSKNHRNKFERNQTDEFVVKAMDIGNLKKIRIGHDAGGIGAAWYLESVSIDCPKLGRKWQFECNDWIDKGDKELYPERNATEEYESCVPYEIVTYTSDLRNAGTSANVYIQVYGRTSCTKKRDLCTKTNRPNKFQRGAKDTFILEMEDVGDPIEKIRIGHDNGGLTSGWHLDRVEIRRMKGNKKGSLTYVFPCNRWLARDEEDRAIERELVAKRMVDQSLTSDGKARRREHETIGTLKMKKYKVHVHTGNERSAGTDANVFCTVYGSYGDTGERKLSDSETHMNKFERGHVDTFTLEAADLGDIFKLKIRHDNSGFGDASWFLDKVEVVDVTDKNKTYVFNCERWLSKDKEDKQLERTLYIKGYEGDLSASSASLLQGRAGSTRSLDGKRGESFGRGSPHRSSRAGSAEDMNDEDTIPYTVTVATGPDRDMASRGPIWIEIHGTKRRRTGKLYLEMLAKDKFERGSVNTFSLDAIDVGDVKKIELGNEGKDMESGWFVKDVRVEQPTHGKIFHFSCDAWLSRDRSDKKTVRTFVLDETDESNVRTFKPKIPYELTIFTGDMEGAGTDNPVYIQLFGSKGSSTEVRLENARERFQRSRTDVVKAEMEDVGSIKKMRVRIDGGGHRPNWFLEKIELRDIEQRKVFHFNCQQWLGKRKGTEGALYVDLPAVVNDRQQAAKTDYQISVKTSDLRGAGTGANVFIKLFGEFGDSGDLNLKKSETSRKPFEAGQLDVFTIKDMVQLGNLARCRVWHDNKGFNTSWHLSHIEVQDVRTKRKWLFPCDKWLSLTDDDKQISRELVCKAAPGEKMADGRVSRGAKTVYELEVVTGDSRDSGTSQDGWVVLEGVRGVTQPPLRLKNSESTPKLRRGQTDVFQFQSPWLGDLQRIVVGAVENRSRPLGPEGRENGRKAQWFCHSITVKDCTTGNKYEFKVKEWLTVNWEISLEQGVSAPVYKVLEDEGKAHVKRLRDKAVIKYAVVTRTGDRSGAGTNANVSITIFGRDGDSGPRALKQKGRTIFSRNQVDRFEIECTDLGDLERVKVEHDDSGLMADWYLEQVEVTNLAENQTWIFPCRAWLSSSKGDGQISKMLYAS